MFTGARPHRPRSLAVALLVLAAAVLLTLLPSHRAEAADYTVTRFDDPFPGPCLPNDCSLREAIRAANAVIGPNTIDLPAGTYTLTRIGANEDSGLVGDLDIHDDVAITGAGVGVTIIDGSKLHDRVFDLTVFASPAVITGVTIRGGGLANQPGGAIHNAGQLSLDHVDLIDNAADNDYGGGIANDGALTLQDVTISGGFSSEGGGLNNFGTANLNRVTITGNAASYGAGVQNAQNGTMNIVNSTISGNHASQNSGGINNFAPGPGTISLYNVTVSNNTADAGAGGIGNYGGVFNLQNTIVSGNIDPSDGDPECIGAFTQGGYNLIASVNAAGCTLGGDPTGSIIGSPATLGPLAGNGGPTQTQALLAGSSGIDAGNPAGCKDAGGHTLSVDQRGAHRPFNGRCDMGAFEFGAAPPPTPTPSPTPSPTPTTKPTHTPTPTPTATPTPTPTPPVDIRNYTFTNQTGQTASDLHIRFSNWPVLPRLVENAPGCPTPTIAGQSRAWDLDWGVACVDNGESVVIEITSEPPATLACFNWTVSGAAIGIDCDATPTPSGIQGDTDCNGTVDAADALFVLRDAAGFPPAACIQHGDVDCDGDRDSVDALAILRYVAGLPPLPQHQPCAAIGTPV